MDISENLQPAQASDLDDVLLDHVHAGVCVIRDMRFLYVNRRLADMLEYDLSDMLGGMDALQIVHPDDRPLVLERVWSPETPAKSPRPTTSASSAAVQQATPWTHEYAGDTFDSRAKSPTSSR